MHHLLQLLAGDPLLLRVGLFLDELRLLDDISGAEEQQTLTRQTVASGAARFLVVALDVFRQVVMNHEAHVRFVDAHAERDGGANHPDFIAQKQLLIAGAVAGLHASVIRRGLHAIGGQPCGDALGRLAALAVNDSALVRARANERERLFVGSGLRRDAVGEVGPVEARDVTTRLAQLEQPDDVRANALGSRGRERHHRRIWNQVAQLRELPIFRAKVMTPFADAMRLVNGEQVHVPLLQIGQKPGKHQPLRRDVEQAELAVVDAAQARPRFVRCE